jgi:phospholipid/cholesterol/gamma-HCH transport system substrate-binding protein
VKRTNNDLIVGVVILTSLFILIAGVLWLKEVSVSQKMVTYTVLFPNIGTLQMGDPVTVNGVKRGSVGKIYLHDAKVAVVINLDKEVAFTDSCTVTIQNIGLMGERMVGIQLSEKGEKHVPDAKNRISFIEGRFDSGIAEAMGLLGSVLTEVLALVDTVEAIIDQTVGTDRFVDFFTTIVSRVDTVLYLVDKLVTDNRQEIDQAIGNVHTITADLKNLLATNRASIDTIIGNGAQLTGAALTIASRIDSVVVAVKAIVSDLEAGKGSVGVLLEDETVIRDLRKSLLGLDSLVNEISDDGLKLRVKVFGNKAYFEKKEN